MFAAVSTVAFVGIEARPVEVQVQVSPGNPYFGIVGLPDKAVAESRERVRAALHAIGLGLPPATLVVLLALSVAAFGIWGALGPFWALPTAFLRGTAAAGGVAGQAQGHPRGVRMRRSGSGDHRPH